MTKNIIVPLEEITVDILKLFFDYDSETGRIFWKEVPKEINEELQEKYGFRKSVGGPAGKEAFVNINTRSGYRQTGLLGQVLLAQRVAWALHYGEWPNGQIELINGNRTDTRIVNLHLPERRATRPVNKRRANVSKYGHHLVKPKIGKQYYLQYMKDGEHIRIGLGRDYEAALKKRDEILTEAGVKFVDDCEK